MADKILVDTNILLYAYDPGEPIKQSQAAAILDRLATLRLGCPHPTGVGGILCQRYP